MKCWGRGLPVLIKRPGRQGGPGEERGAGCSRAWPLSGSLTWAHPEVQLPPQQGEETACPGHRPPAPEGRATASDRAKASGPRWPARSCLRSPQPRRARPCTPLLAVQRSRDVARRRWSVSCFPPSKGRAVVHCGVCLRENKLTSAISDFFRASRGLWRQRTVWAERGCAAAVGSVTVCASECSARTCGHDRSRRAPGDGARCRVPGAMTCDSSCPPVRREETHRC